MKVLICASGSLGVLGHALARQLQEAHGITEFAAQTFERSVERLMLDQRDVAYTSVSHWEFPPHAHSAEANRALAETKLDPSLLARFERDYGDDTLWSYLMTDRDVYVPTDGHPQYGKRGFRYDYDDLRKLLQLHFQRAESLLDEAQPDVITCMLPGRLGILALEAVAKQRGIARRFIARPRIGNLTTIGDSKNEGFSAIFDAFDELLAGRSSDAQADAEEYLARIQDSHPSYEGFKTWVVTAEHWRPSAGKTLARLVRRGRDVGRSTLDYAGGARDEKAIATGPLDRVRALATEEGRRLRLATGDWFSDMESNEEFVLFPLHVEPEISLLLLGSHYTDQVHVIEEVARSIPSTMRLYVKEHPNMYAMRPMSFYARIKALPNVRLIHPGIDSHDVIRRSQLVMTISGTVGLEAIFLGKRAVVLGDAFYRAFDPSMRAERIEDIAGVIRHALAAPEPEASRVLAFATAIFECSVPVDLRRLYRMSRQGNLDAIMQDEHLERLAGLLATNLPTSVGPATL